MSLNTYTGTLRQFTDAHVLGPSLAIDWDAPEENLPTLVHEAVSALNASLPDSGLAASEREAVEHNLHLWHDDLRRAHLMSNPLSMKEVLTACASDQAVQQALVGRDPREQSLWMLAHRDKIFRDSELHIAFQAKTNGKYWKKHRIQRGLDPTQDRDKLEAFCHEVATLYKKVGGGDGTHIEVSRHSSGDSVQLTIYVEGPITALAHFSENHFKRITTRIALEAALVYQPSTGFIETVVKGGVRNHTAVLELFGRHVVGQQITPEEIEKTRYKLNVLRDGMLEPFEDWSQYGVEKVRLRRARFTPKGSTGISFKIEASPDKDQDDAIRLALDNLQIHHSFEAEYNMDGATVMVYTMNREDRRTAHFSFDLYSTGSSTIKNLSDHNQHIANAVLRALNVIENQEVGE
ncbi:MAG: glycine hydroxymethyltransferase [Proteobacteria bacterium]|nr:glycine hydroxymethyltransferase [Pseudomonadota bacterium]